MSKQQGSISVTQGAGMLLATLLGSGVLLVPALVASESGVYSLLAWLLMALAILPIVFTFAVLGKRYPDQGGTAHFVKLAFGRRASASLAWLYVSIAPIGPPVVLITGAAYLTQLLGLSLSVALLVELLMLAVILLLNVLKLTTSVRFQTLLSFIVTAIIITICSVALWQSDQPLPAGELVPWQVGQSMATIFWCFVGIEAICHVSNDFKRPEIDFPRAVLLGVVMAGAIYFVLSIAVLKYGAYGSEAKNLLSVLFVAQSALGYWGHRLMALVGFIACFCAVNLYVLSFARMLASMAEQGHVPKRLGQTNANLSPVLAVLVVVFVIAFVLIIRAWLDWSFASLLAYANAVFVLIYLAAGLAAIKLLSGIGRYWAWFTTLFCGGVALLMGVDVLYGLAVFFLTFVGYHLQQKRLARKPATAL
ncbi:L-methionine/branched-chain amino acid transporter [Motilimonas cestriensis]|uniref:L-methionine/branched-chain amino acid transporter n=1 Tax=Motilimonas cestriensis TaxID=2742685 RepID=A0ABS8W929_9GAMM|nr:L-methionine/branched-chain amino acid transporter [Motilimonas cestriensis]MCE2593885.1 L-methionine/branched-chain amino acid transporter [Motilimonas cestriensis]